MSKSSDSKRYSNRFGIRMDAAGFTLMETMTALSVAGIVSLAFVSLVILAIKYYNITAQKIEVETEIYSATGTLKSFLSQSMDLGFGGSDCTGKLIIPSSLPSIPSTVAGGVIRLCDTATMPSGQTIALAAFAREALKSGDKMIGGADTDPKPVYNSAVSFTTPYIDAKNHGHFGTLWLSTQLSGGAPSILNPKPSDTNFTRLVRVATQNFKLIDPNLRQVMSFDPRNGVGVSKGWYVASFEVSLTFRVFLDGHYQDWAYCPSGYTDPGCEKIASEPRPFKDYVRTMLVVARNNRIYANWSDTTARRRILGNIYFYDFMSPFGGK